MTLWIKRMGLLFLAVGIVAGLSGCTLISKLKARDHLNKGSRLYGEKKFEEAAAEFRESIKNDPELTNSYLYLAMAHAASAGGSQEKTKEAIRMYQEVVDKAGERTDLKSIAMTSIAVLYEDLNDVDKAKAWCRKLLELQPSNVEALYRIAVIDFKISFAKTGNTGEGVKRLSEDEHKQTVQIIEEGITALNEALRQRPDYSNAVDYLNLLYREKAKFTTEDAQKRELIRKADQLSIRALELHRKEEAEKAKVGKSKKIA